jgi:hypothetical protein
MTKIFKGHCLKCGLVSDDKILFKTRGNCKTCSNEWHRKNMEGRYEKVENRYHPRGNYWKIIFRENMPIDVTN